MEREYMNEKDSCKKMYDFNCIVCGYSWCCTSADVSECPMCTSRDIVLLQSRDYE